MTATTEEATYAGPVRFDLIDKHIAWAEAEQAKGEKGQWNQGTWGETAASCGTAFCIAGHVAMEAGYKPASRWKTTRVDIVKPGRTFAWYEDWSEVLAPGVARSTVLDTHGDLDYDNPNVLDVSWVASDLLGLGHDPELFGGYNTIQDLKRIRDQYALREGYPTKYEEINA